MVANRLNPNHTFFYISPSISKRQPSCRRTIDIIPIYVYKGMMYWKENSELMVAPYNDSSIDVRQGSKVDQLNSGLLPAEMFEIIEQLEKA